MIKDFNYLKNLFICFLYFVAGAEPTLAGIFANLNSRECTSSNLYSVGRARLDESIINNSIELGDDTFDVPLQYLGNESNSKQLESTLHVRHLQDGSISKSFLGIMKDDRRRYSLNNDEVQLAIPMQVHCETNANIIKDTTNFQTLKTGTTIVGIKTSNCIIIGADTRATEGSVVADKLCEKVHQLSQNVWCCGAGTSADLDSLTRKIRYTFLLKSMIYESIGNHSTRRSTNRFIEDEHRDLGEEYLMDGVEEDACHPLGQASISEICNVIRENLYRNRGEIGANLVLGGFDPCTRQPILTAIHPHGSIDVVPFTALGSGSLAAMGILESRYKVDISTTEGIELVKDAVRAGIENDLGSGSQIDLCVIDKTGVKYIKGARLEEILPPLESEEDTNRKLFLDHTSEEVFGSVDGVNGFGSLPYRIKSRTKLIEDQDRIEERGKKWLRSIL